MSHSELTNDLDSLGDHYEIFEYCEKTITSIIDG